MCAQSKFTEVRVNCAHSMSIDFGCFILIVVVLVLPLLYVCLCVSVDPRRIGKYLNASLAIYNHCALRIETFACDWLRGFEFNWITLNNAFRVRNYQLNKQYLNGSEEEAGGFSPMRIPSIYQHSRKWGFSCKIFDMSQEQRDTILTNSWVLIKFSKWR